MQVDGRWSITFRERERKSVNSSISIDLFYIDGRWQATKHWTCVLSPYADIIIKANGVMMVFVYIVSSPPFHQPTKNLRSFPVRTLDIWQYGWIDPVEYKISQEKNNIHPFLSLSVRYAKVTSPLYNCDVSALCIRVSQCVYTIQSIGYVTDISLKGSYIKQNNTNSKKKKTNIVHHPTVSWFFFSAVCRSSIGDPWLAASWTL
jgi:hypothetical protein